jgi:hypothetical protein
MEKVYLKRIEGTSSKQKIRAPSNLDVSRKRNRKEEVQEGIDRETILNVTDNP